MIITAEELKILARSAREASRIAGEYIISQRNRVPAVHVKEGVSSRAAEVVTAIDTESQALILDHLQPLTDDFDLGLLAEEAPDDGSRLEKDYFWCIDPLDGTLAFVEQRTGYAVSIALVSRAGVPLIGVTHDPITGDFYQAIRGHGHQFAETDEQEGEKLVCFFDQSMNFHPNYETILMHLKDVAKNRQLSGIDVRYGRGSVLNACHVAQLRHAVYFKMPKREPGGGSFWDFAATACLFAEAGLSATDVFGGPLLFDDQETTFMNRRGVIYASSKGLHEAICKLAGELLSSEDRAL